MVSARRAPKLSRTLKGIPGTGPIRLLPVDGGADAERLWVVAADAPLDRFNEDAINSRLSNVDWVARAAVAHERVVASFLQADGLLPMKLFTIFTSDERATAHVLSERTHLDRVLDRVAKHDEWGVRVLLDSGVASRGAKSARAVDGTSYLARKKAQRDARSELVERSQEVVADLYDALAAQAGGAHRRPASEIPAKNGPLLLDAAFLVPRSRASRFRSTLARQARELQPKGYQLSLSGPWPPYSFMQDA